MLPTNKPIVNFSVRELSRMQTLLHYELMALHKESKEAKTEEDLLEIAVRKNKARMMFDFVKGLLSNYQKIQNYL